MPRKQPETTGTPLVSAKRGKFTTLEGVAIDAQIHEQLGEYKLFVKEVDGEEPTDGAVVSVALERLFGSDTAFQNAQANARRGQRNGSVNGSAAKTNAASEPAKKREAATA